MCSLTYGNRGELLEVNNASTAGTISKYVYTYDAVGRRIGCAKSGSAFTTPDTNAYLYNTRSELTNATAAVDALYRYGYNFDDIGNRKTSAERGANSAYAANPLNQYSTVDDFTPVYDVDGNQTLVKTATGVWSVTYDAENRPIVWDNGSTNIIMTYDRLCRRISKNGVRYVYKDFLQILNSYGDGILWNPAETGLTKPLAVFHKGCVSYYTHDGNKNVSEVLASDGSINSHYAYSPFGAVDATHSYDVGNVENFFRFSSEYFDDEIGTIYYNFRTFNPYDGRWIGRDPGEELFSCNLYWYVNNQPIGYSDWLGLDVCRESNSDFSLNKTFDRLGGAIGSVSISYHRSIQQKRCYIKCDDCSSGYSIERSVTDGGGGGMSWNIPIPGLPGIVKVPLSIAYTMSGGEYYYYNSCTKEEKYEKCNSFSLSGSLGGEVGIGKFISYSISGVVQYTWTDCGGESSSLAFNLSVQQCYFGQCWSVDIPVWDIYNK